MRADLVRLARPLVRLIGAIALALLLGCETWLPEEPEWLMEDAFVAPVTDGVWQHVSFRDYPGFGRVASNGAIVETNDGVVFIDTAWTPEQTGWLIDWALARFGRVRAVYITHAHEDRMAGLPEFTRRGIDSLALGRTVQRAAALGLPPIAHTVEDGSSLSDVGIDGEIVFPGGGHTEDNAAIWLAGPRVLYAGCLVRSMATGTLGNTRDADLASWPGAIAYLQEKYPEAEFVIPGHGDPGGPELLDHTAELLGANRSTP